MARLDWVYNGLGKYVIARGLPYNMLILHSKYRMRTKEEKEYFFEIPIKRPLWARVSTVLLPVKMYFFIDTVARRWWCKNWPRWSGAFWGYLPTGYGLKEMAPILFVSYGTIRWHLVNLRRVFKVRTTRELLHKLETSCFTDSATATTIIKLSPRGRQVFELFRRSFTYRQIAERLGMSVSGVRRHCEKMLWKNGCDTMLALIAKHQAQCGVEQQSER